MFQGLRKNQQIGHSQTSKYKQSQQELPDDIKSLHDSGLSYRRITKLLNKKGIKTHTGTEQGETGNSVYSFLTEYRLRERR